MEFCLPGPEPISEWNKQDLVAQQQKMFSMLYGSVQQYMAALKNDIQVNDQERLCTYYMILYV